MTARLQKRDNANNLETLIIQGDLKQLSSEERLVYYNRLCESLQLNPLTRPFEYLTLNGKLILYAKKDCTEQLRRIHNVSIQIVSRERLEDVYVVTTRATLPSGRADESIGAVSLSNLKGDALCNAFMKAETKAKRRATLSICGLGLLDEIEAAAIPTARPVIVESNGDFIEVETNGAMGTKLSDLATPEQLTEIFTIAKARGLNADAESQLSYQCDAAELSRVKAQEFIQHLKTIRPSSPTQSEPSQREPLATAEQKSTIRDLGAELVTLKVYANKQEGWQDAVNSTVSVVNPDGKPKLDSWTEAEATYLIHKWTEAKEKAQRVVAANPDDGIPF